MIPNRTERQRTKALAHPCGNSWTCEAVSMSANSQQEAKDLQTMDVAAMNTQTGQVCCRQGFLRGEALYKIKI